MNVEMNIDNNREAKRILVVDDEDDARKLLKGFLEDEPYSIVEACNGIEMFTKMQELSFDLVILDIVMPEMDGIEVLEKMKERDIDTKVIVTSGGKGEFDAEYYLYSAKKFEVCGTLSKPFDADEMISLIKEVLS